MGQRRDLSAILNSLGAEKVYFQAPSEDVMVFPCILYGIDTEVTVHADNNPYSRTIGYQVTVIDRDVDSKLPGKVASLPRTSFVRFFVQDGLNHSVYKLFF